MSENNEAYSKSIVSRRFWFQSSDKLYAMHSLIWASQFAENPYR